jgi:hypothetical protein
MLEQEIRSDIDERQKLMLQTKTLYLRYEFNEKDKLLFLIYSIPTIYAIWEGFIQTAFQSYIRELNKLELTIDTICNPILIHHLESKFKQFREYPKAPDKKKSFFKNLDKFYTERVIDINTTVNTKSNVEFDVLNDLLEAFNLEKIPDYIEPRYSLKQKLHAFVITRNAVAHGQYSDSNVKPEELKEKLRSKREDLINAIELVNKLMDIVFEKIIEGFKNKSYLLPH